MAKVMTRGGKPLISDGKVALSTGNCCGPCGGGGTGACCYDDETCAVVTTEACAAAGGTFQGSGTTCSGIDCTQGPCCALDGSGDCSITTPDDCDGNYIGGGLTCDDVDCTQGACCVDGVCSVTTETGCDTAGGTYSGNGTTCDNDVCVGACCATDGTCSLISESACAISGGQYQGNGTTCDSVDCSNGACCVAGVCSQQTSAACAGLGGTFLAYGVPCIPNPCVECVCGGFLNPCDGLYYKTKTISGHGTYTDTDGGHRVVWNFTSLVIYTCVGGTVSCSGGGSGTWFVDDVLQKNYFGDCGPDGDTNTWDTFGGTPYWHLDESGNCSPCPKNTESGWSTSIDTCYHKQYTLTHLARSATVDAYTAYSNPCVLTGFSPPP